jgi:hypothetical protein
MRLYVVERVDDEAETASAVNDHRWNNDPTGAFTNIGRERWRDRLTIGERIASVIEDPLTTRDASRRTATVHLVEAGDDV